jgi:hypothetical protein
MIPLVSAYFVIQTFISSSILRGVRCKLVHSDSAALRALR